MSPTPNDVTDRVNTDRERLVANIPDDVVVAFCSFIERNCEESAQKRWFPLDGFERRFKAYLKRFRLAPVTRDTEFARLLDWAGYEPAWETNRAGDEVLAVRGVRPVDGDFIGPDDTEGADHG